MTSPDKYKQPFGSSSGRRKYVRSSSVYDWDHDEIRAMKFMRVSSERRNDKQIEYMFFVLFPTMVE